MAVGRRQGTRRTRGPLGAFGRTHPSPQLRCLAGPLAYGIRSIGSRRCRLPVRAGCRGLAATTVAGRVAGDGRGDQDCRQQHLRGSGPADRGYGFHRYTTSLGASAPDQWILRRPSTSPLLSVLALVEHKIVRAAGGRLVREVEVVSVEPGARVRFSSPAPAGTPGHGSGVHCCADRLAECTPFSRSLLRRTGWCRKVP